MCGFFKRIKFNPTKIEPTCLEPEYKPNPPKPHVKRDNNIPDIDTLLIDNILVQDFKIEIEPTLEPLKKESNHHMDSSNAFSEKLEHIILEAQQPYQPNLTTPSMPITLESKIA